VIARLAGVVAEKAANHAVVDVNGVGYRVFLSVLSLGRLPEAGQPVQLRIQTVVRDDALDLFGFLTQPEEEMFLLLTSVSQVGPKLAINVLSGLEVESLAHALSNADVGKLTQIHGVGKKTAERLVLELKDKVKWVGRAAKAETLPAPGPQADLVSALVNLGYKPAQAEKAARTAAERAGAKAPLETLLREALKGLRSAV
jgi:Holliday junction DNA helicase RuvA